MHNLEELKPSVSASTIYQHIPKLIDAAIVEEVAPDDDQRRQGSSGRCAASPTGDENSGKKMICLPRRRHSRRFISPSPTNPNRRSNTRTCPVSMTSTGTPIHEWVAIHTF